MGDLAGAAAAAHRLKGAAHMAGAERLAALAAAIEPSARAGDAAAAAAPLGTVLAATLLAMRAG